MRNSIAVAAVLFLAGCSEDPAPQSPAGAESCPIDVELLFPPTAEREIVARGTIRTLQSDVTIRSVVVGGVSAHADTFNFQTWSAPLSRDQLLALPDADAGPAGSDGSDAGPPSRRVIARVLITAGVGGAARACEAREQEIVVLEATDGTL